MATEHRARWVVLADYFSGTDDKWLDDFIESPNLSFEKVPPPARSGSWHMSKRQTTSLDRWRKHYRQVQKGFGTRPDGMITSFPQLAMIAGLRKRLLRKRFPIIAYNFNLGQLPKGPRQNVARFAAKAIDRFVVHSPSEIEPYASYLGVPQNQVFFVPLQRGSAPATRVEDTENPYIIAMGSAHRDYPTLIDAVDHLKIPTVIVTRASDIPALPESEFVSYRSDLSYDECLQLLAQARLSVTPIANLETASGQITFIDSLRSGVPTIATRCIGTEGYITHEKTGLLVEPFDVDEMKTAISRLWSDAAAREALAQAAVTDATARFTDTAAAERLHDMILDVSDNTRAMEAAERKHFSV